MADLKLSFLNNKLSKEQLQQAQKVAKAAAAMGIDPSFAVSIAFKESSLNPSTVDSDKGAIGMMQVMPATGKAYGYSEEDLRKPDINLRAGLRNLKESLEYANNNPKLAAIYYHSGPDEIKAQAAGKDLGPNALEYLKALKGFGTFEAFNPDFKAPAEAEATSAPAEQPEPTAPPPPSDADSVKILTEEQDFIRPDSEADLKRKEYGLYGLGTGTGVAIAPKASQIASGALGRTMRAFDEGRRAPSSPKGGLPTGGAPTPPQMPPSAPTGGSMGAPAGGLPQGQPVMGVSDAGRMAQGQTGVIPYNTAKALGVTDIEAGQALTNTKQQGGAWDIATKRAEALNKLQGMGMGNFVENPMYGGIMTQGPNVGRGVRVDPTTGVPQSFAMRVPEGGQAAELAPIPKARTIPTVPPLPSGLDYAKNLFTGIMNQSMRLMPMIGPPLAGLSIARDIADIETQYDRAPINRDYTDIGLSGASALAAGASLYPPAFPIAAPLSIGIPTFRNIRRNVLAQESDPELQKRYRMPPTPEEIEMANRPFVGYPSIR